MMPEGVLFVAFMLAGMLLQTGGYAVQLYSVEAYKGFVNRQSIILNELCDNMLAIAR